MDNLAILPRTLPRRTRWGTATLNDRRQGLLAREAAGRWRVVSPEELRRGCPEGLAVRLRFAASLQAGEAASAGNQRGGGHAV